MVETDSPATDSLRFELFSVGEGYGFNILKNEKIYIHQPIIPCIQGMHAFSSEKDAQILAKFLVARLQSEKFKFLIEKSDLDSLLKTGKINIQFTDNPNASFLDSFKLNDQFIEDQKLSPIEKYASLSEAPTKKRWTVKENVPFGYRGGGFTFVIGQFLYIGSGECYDAMTKDFWRYDPNSQTWTCLAEIPIKCFSGISFSLFQMGYAGLGTEIGTSSGKFENHMFQYDPNTNTWKKIRNFPGTPRIDASVFVIGNNAYAGTGYDGTNTSDFYKYDPLKDDWSRIADFAGGNIHASIGIGNGKKGFLVAGARAPQDFKFLYEYISGADKWVKRKDMPGITRNFHCGNYIDTNYIIAGCGGSYEKNLRQRDFYIYDIASDVWGDLPDYPADKRGNSRPSSGTVNGKAFFGTGFNGEFTNDWNVFEYYYSSRIDTGDYNETISYPLKYNGQWELFEECINEDCFAGAEIKTSEQLGNFLYSSRYAADSRSISLTDEAKKKLIVFPRNFLIATDKQPKKPVSIRLFFTKSELEKTLSDCNKKTGILNSLNNVKVLQCNEEKPDTNPYNNNFQKKTYSLIKPQWYCYGYNGETIVAEFSVTTLNSEFYLIL
ncbi:MAG: DUF4907 domain-containing protein [Ferruginibacter sp.]